ncbi:DUF2875 domain-containing protein [Trinickia caryophylli]|nr:DUF2875 domain-containing protein [Trinickia caryophylli]TRX15476.1 DUF2875 domain-containing protein [Trinickia caryophylli]
MLAGTGEKYALEIRAIGLAVKGAHQDTVWKQIQEKANNYETILSSDPKSCGKNRDERRVFSDVATGAAFEYAAGEAVDHWPVPVIIIGPPRGPNSRWYRAAVEIVGGRQSAGLGVTEFLWVNDHNTTSAAPAVTELFEFFDKHPDVPAALILTQDGMQYRWAAETPGTPPEPPGPFIPPIPDSMGGLLVTRTDRVDRLVRPYAVQMTADIDKTKTQYDVVKQWNFYWDKDAQAEKAAKAAGQYDAGTMKADWWISQLPELWKQIGNKGPGDFKPSPFLPVRWANWQVEEFDEAPRLGYLHRPVEVKLTDDHGKPLRRADEAQRLQDGWKQALATLPEGVKPARVFYDTTLDRAWAIPLTQALRGDGLDLGNVEEGYDIGRRIGNTGVSSALVQLCLATVAGYEQGGASATVNLIDGKSASIVMVSPPDAASKAANQKNRGPNPFKYRAP